MRPPAFDAASRHVSTAQDEIGIFGCPEKVWQIFGLMRKVRIHFKNELVALIERPSKAVKVGIAQSSRAVTVNYMDSSVVLSELVCNCTCAVWTEIIDH